jgi:hypothetical protein
MATNKSSQWIIGIIIYFIMLSTVFGVVSNIQEEFDLDSQNYINSSGGTSSFGFYEGVCASPRFDATENGNIIIGLSERDVYDPNFNVFVTNGLIYDEETCLAYEGSSWEETVYIGFIHTGDYKCSGVINQTYYNYGNNYTDNVDSSSLWNEPVCGLAKLQDSKQLCLDFGCTYYTTEEAEAQLGEVKALSGLWSVGKVAWNVATLRLDFYTDSSLINGLLTFFLIWVEIIALILAIYEMVRG